MELTIRILTVLIACATLCCVSETARAQIFVTNLNNSTVGEYNATTGAPINPSFISAGLDGPNSIVVKSSVPDGSSALSLLLLGLTATFSVKPLLPG
jgi:hypothetical protein